MHESENSRKRFIIDNLWQYLAYISKSCKLQPFIFFQFLLY